MLVGVLLLFVFGFGYGFSQYVAMGGGGALLGRISFVVAGALLGVILLLCALAAAAWMYWGWRLARRADPWAYDPELDGPDADQPTAREGAPADTEIPGEEPEAPKRP